MAVCCNLHDEDIDWGNIGKAKLRFEQIQADGRGDGFGT